MTRKRAQESPLSTGKHLLVKPGSLPVIVTIPAEYRLQFAIKKLSKTLDYSPVLYSSASESISVRLFADQIVQTEHCITVDPCLCRKESRFFR